MHEYGIVRALLKMATEAVAGQGGGRILRLEVRLGELAGVDPGLLVTAFELLRTDSPCADAALHITQVAARWACASCGEPVAAGGPLRCSTCGSAATLVEGDELMLTRCEMEVGDV